MRAGDRVSLRVRTPDGPAEVLGTLVAASAQTLSVRRADGSVAVVDVDAVQAGRVVPPALSQTISAWDLELVAAAGWRALESEWVDGWLLRASGGFTGRANSALVPPAFDGDVAATLARVSEWYSARGLPTRLQLIADSPMPPRPGAGPAGDEPAGPSQVECDVSGASGGSDAPETSHSTALALGWERSMPVHVMTAEIAAVLRSPVAKQAAEAATGIAVDESPSPQWLAAYPRTAEVPEVATAVLTNHPQAAFVSATSAPADPRLTAIARVAVDGRWAGLFAVHVADGERRSGHATAVSVAALRWAVAHGARRAYLQVQADNAPAIALYERLGFTHHHDYTYATRSTPAANAQT